MKIQKKKIQPPVLPRPDLSSLGISYRRIPLISHNSQIYLDTRLVISHLESCPSLAATYPPLGSEPGTSDLAVQSLLSVLTTGTDLFFRAAELLPPSLPLMKDKAFLRDRADFFPQPSKGAADSYALKRAEALTAVRDAVEMMETTILADGRDWVLGTETPRLADVEGVWVFHWLLSEKYGLQGAVYDAEAVNEKKYPKVFAWVRRFEGHLEGLPKVEQGKVKGEEARGLILGAAEDSSSSSAEVDATEPVVRALGLKKGDEVEVWPTDSGSNHRDKGKLVGLNKSEVVWENGKGVKVHAPRKGFRVVKVAEEGKGKL